MVWGDYVEGVEMIIDHQLRKAREVARRLGSMCSICAGDTDIPDIKRTIANLCHLIRYYGLESEDGGAAWCELKAKIRDWECSKDYMSDEELKCLSGLSSELKIAANSKQEILRELAIVEIERRKLPN